MFKLPEKLRVSMGDMRFEEGKNGYFQLTRLQGTLNIVASDGLGWEHVSVSHPARIPTWAEMCKIKSLFWDEEDLVVQFHPPKSQYVNCHPRTLHLWRYYGTNDFCKVPSTYLIGPKND